MTLSAPDRARVNAQRAVAVYEAMQRWLYAGGRNSLYRETTWPTAEAAYLWPFSRALLGTLTLAGVPSGLVGGANYTSAVQDRLVCLERYWDGASRVPAYDSAVRPPLGRGGDKYYDDNAWVALALIQLVRMGLGRSLDRVAQLFAFAQSGWGRVPDDPYPGGVFWVQQGLGLGISNHDRGAGATAGSAEIGLHLRELTGIADHEGDGDVSATAARVGARNMLDWVGGYLDRSGAGAGPFLNLVRRDGSVDTNIWSYNQGVMLGARVLQHRLTGESAYLSQAEQIARQTLDTFGDFANHPPTFNAMCFQNMLMLHASTIDAELQSRILGVMARYADWAWDPLTGARDAKTNLFTFDDAGRPARGQHAPRLEDQGALTQLFALLAWDPGSYAKLT